MLEAYRQSVDRPTKERFKSLTALPDSKIVRTLINAGWTLPPRASNGGTGLYRKRDDLFCFMLHRRRGFFLHQKYNETRLTLFRFGRLGPDHRILGASHIERFIITESSLLVVDDLETQIARFPFAGNVIFRILTI